MTFMIDTGEPKTFMGYPPSQMLDAILDRLPENPTQNQLDSAVYEHCMWTLRRPRRLETVRKHLIALWWPFLAPLSQSSPECMDSILSEYAEIITVLG